MFAFPHRWGLECGGTVNLTGHVWFFDTLKKMANVIHKDSLKHVLGLMRKLSGRGMTCVLLAHTNKYKTPTVTISTRAREI